MNSIVLEKNTIRKESYSPFFLDDYEKKYFAEMKEGRIECITLHDNSKNDILAVMKNSTFACKCKRIIVSEPTADILNMNSTFVFEKADDEGFDKRMMSKNEYYFVDFFNAVTDSFQCSFDEETSLMISDLIDIIDDSSEESMKKKAAFCFKMRYLNGRYHRNIPFAYRKADGKIRISIPLEPKKFVFFVDIDGKRQMRMRFNSHGDIVHDVEMANFNGIVLYNRERNEKKNPTTIVDDISEVIKTMVKEMR